MLKLVLNDDHLSDVLGDLFSLCRHRLFISTADVKDLHVPAGGSAKNRQARSIVEIFHEMSRRNVEISLLHAGIPSGAFLEEMKRAMPSNLTMRRCVRVHAKAVIADGKWMYMGSANLTGAGLGAKSPRRRNFEAGIWTDDIALIDPVVDMLEDVFAGGQCQRCGRKDSCPVPLEEPEL